MSLRNIATLAVCLAIACSTAEPTIETATEVVTTAARLTPGRAHVWTLDWHTEAAASEGFAAGGLAGGLALRGSLVIAAVANVHGGTQMTSWLADLDHAELRVGGEAIALDPAAMVGPRAYFVVDSDGYPTALSFEPGTPPVFRELMAGVIARVDLHATGRGAQARIGAGLANVAYRRGADGLVTRELEALRRVDVVPGVEPEALTVTAHAELHLDAAGVPERLWAEDHATLGDDGEFYADEHFSIARVREQDMIVAMPEVLEPARDPLAPPDLEAAEHELAVQRAGDTTVQDVQIAMQTMDGGTMPRRGFVSAASALVIAYPEKIAELERLSGESGGYGRQLLFDVFSSAGTPQAQAAMVRLLSSPSATAWTEAPLLAQRFTFVLEPTPASAQFLLEHELAVRTADPRLARALLYPMGTIASRLEDPWLGEQLHARLLSRLGEADPEVRRAALGGLGNLGRPDDADRIIAAIDSEDAGVRVEAVAALRELTGPRARSALLAALGDRDEAVATRAIGVYRDRFEDAADSVALAERVQAGGVHPSVVPKLADLLHARAEDGPSIVAAAATLQ